MRKYALVFGLVVVSVVVWVASASAAGSPKVFNLLAVDNGKGQPINGFMFDRQPVAGDAFPISENLYKWAGTKKGAPAGHDLGIATFVNVGQSSQTTLFTVTAYLNGGTVFVNGMSRTVNGPASLTLPIVGGTGKYAGARGYVNVRPLGNGGGNNPTWSSTSCPNPSAASGVCARDRARPRGRLPCDHAG